jgi:hypothetical protein
MTRVAVSKLHKFPKIAGKFEQSGVYFALSFVKVVYLSERNRYGKRNRRSHYQP